MVGELIHKMSTGSQAMHDDHHVLRQRRKFVFHFHRLELFEAMFQRAERVAAILRIDQPIVAHHGAALNAPIMINDFVRPG